MRAGRQKKGQYVIIGSLSLVLCSATLSTTFTSSASALLHVDTFSPLKQESPTVIKKITSRVPIVSPIFNPPEDSSTRGTQASPRQDNTPSGNGKTASDNSTKSSEDSAKPSSERSSATTAPIITPQKSQFDILQPGGMPYFGANAKLASLTVEPATKPFAVLEPSEEGWRLFSIAWYWWIAFAVAAVGIILWRERLLVLVLASREKAEAVLRSKW